MDRGAWQATVHRVAKSRTRLGDFTSLHFMFSKLTVHACSKHLIASYRKCPSHQ